MMDEEVDRAYFKLHRKFRDELADYVDMLAGRAGTTPLSLPLRPPQPGEAA